MKLLTLLSSLPGRTENHRAGPAHEPSPHLLRGMQGLRNKEPSPRGCHVTAAVSVTMSTQACSWALRSPAQQPIAALGMTGVNGRVFKLSAHWPGSQPSGTALVAYFGSLSDPELWEETRVLPRAVKQAG